MHRPRMADLLTRAFREHADDVPLARRPAGDADRIAVALAAPHRKCAGPAQELSGDRHRQQLDLGHVVEGPARVHAEHGRVDCREVVDRDDRPARRRKQVVAVAPTRSDPTEDRRNDSAVERPGALGVLAEELVETEPGQHPARVVIS